jgi:hypothetical protein
MTELVAYVIIALSLGVGVFAGWHVIKGYRFSNPLFWALGLVEVALIAALIGGSIALAHSSGDVQGVLFISYLVTALVVPPVAVIWGVTDQTKWGTGVVVIAMVTVSALLLRIQQIWELGQ